MKQVSELQKTLFHFFDWNKARLECLVQILQALFAVRTVNLTQKEYFLKWERKR